MSVDTTRDPALNAIAAAGAACRADETDVFLKDTAPHFEGDVSVAIEYARVPHRRGDWPEALRRWQLVRARFPERSEGVTGTGIALRELGRIDELDQMLASAVKSFPDLESLAIEYARVAHRRRDWSTAQHRWETARARFPDSQTIQEESGAARFHLNNDALGENNIRKDDYSGLYNDGATKINHLSRCDLMMRFESLGSGCEFGLVQRHFGAEPLSLFRWGAIPPLALAEALDLRFERIGDPDSVRLFELGDSKEYFFRDERYSLEMHTFMSVHNSDYDRVFAQQCRRAKFLRDKLVNDLESGEQFSKIFVYKRHVGSLSDNEAQAIHQAIRRYGKHTLLCVRPEREEHPNGTVDACADGLLIAYIDSLSPTSNAHEIKYDSWLAICTTAMQLRSDLAVSQSSRTQ